MTWISVKDRLPDDSKTPMAGVEVNIVLSNGVVTSARFRERYWFSLGLIGKSIQLDYEHVTHWQPLPEPPGPSLAEISGKKWVSETDCVGNVYWEYRIPDPPPQEPKRQEHPAPEIFSGKVWDAENEAEARKQTIESIQKIIDDYRRELAQAKHQYAEC